MRFLPILLFIFSFCTNAQVAKKDSIQKIINSSSDESYNSILYANVSEFYVEKDIDSSIYYATKGYDLAKSIKYEIGQAENLANLGYYHVIKNDLSSSKDYYENAVKMYSETDSIFKYTQCKMRLGNINLAQNNFVIAYKLYQDCLEISKTENFKTLLPHLYNNLGLVYKQIEEYDDALNSFDEAYKLFLEVDDEADSTYPRYNIALIQSILGKDKEAINGYLDLVGYHLKTENWVSLAGIYNSISEIYLKNENYEQSQKYLEMALNAIKDKSDSYNTGPKSYNQASIYYNAAELYYKLDKDNLSQEYAYKSLDFSLDNSYKLNVYKSAKILADIFDQKNSIDSSLYYYKIYSSYKEEYQDEYDVKQITTLKMQNEFDNILKQKEIDRIIQKTAYEKKELKYLIVIISVFMILVIITLLYFNQKNKNAKLSLIEENLKLEKTKLDQTLGYKKKELVSSMMYLLEKNEFINSISKKLIGLKTDAKKDNKELIQQIINEIKRNSSSGVWDEFEVRFKEVHEKFYEALYQKHPNLTPNEVKLCAFLRLSMSTKEISAITHQSVKSIKMARFRLRKKIDLDRDENLITYLRSL